MVINIFKSIFMWSFIISMLLSVFTDLNKKDVKSSPSEENKTSKIELTITTIVVLTTVAIVVCGFILIIFKYENLLWITVFVSTPVYLGYIVGAYSSVGIIRNVVQLEAKDRLSVREYWAIQTIAYVLFFLNVSKLPTKLIAFLKTIENNMVYDLLYITLYILLFFLYAFLICALLSRPLILLSNLMIKLNVLLKNKTRLFKMGDFFIKEIDKNNLKRHLLIAIIKMAKTRGMALYTIVWILSPIFFVADICLSILRMLRSFLFESIGYLFLLFRMIKRTMGKLMIWINNLSDRRLVATSFRLALIVTLALTVIVNRYTPLLREYESSTGVLEFVSSAILIPVIFQWIASVNNRKDIHKEK